MRLAAPIDLPTLALTIVPERDDEPTGNLDTATGAGVLNLLHRISDEQGRAVVIVTHDREIVDQAPTLLEMRDGTLETIKSATD